MLACRCGSGGVQPAPAIWLRAPEFEIQPQPRLQLCDHNDSIDHVELERLLAAYRPSVCLTPKATAIEFLNRYRRSGAEIVALTESLAVIERR